MINNFRFESPIFLLLLLIIPIILLIEKKYKSQNFINYSSLGILKSTVKEKRVNPLFFIKLLKFITIFLFILSLSRPQITKSSSEIILKDAINIMLTLDTSRSMEAIDLEINGQAVNRLVVVKEVVKEFITKRQADQIGLVVFGTEAFTQAPLTSDKNILLDFLEKIDIGIAGDSTAIGSAIGLSVKRLKDTEAKSKVIILLTDGENKAGKLSPDKAAELAKKYNIKVYTIGVGTSGQVPIIQNTFLGPRKVYINSKLDEQSLQKIASVTGGKYYRAKNIKELKNIYADIDKLEKSKIKTKNFTEYKEIFRYFLIPALILFLLLVILSNTRYIQIP